MHYVALLATRKHESDVPGSFASKALFNEARHLCEASERIKERVHPRPKYRQLLLQAAELARMRGSRSLGVRYYKYCLLVPA